MALFGLLYLAATLTLSVYYLNSSMTNDLWWPSFNVSAHQSYLIDVYNAQLVLTRNASTTLDLTSSAFGISKDYSRRNTPILVTPVYPRIVVDALSQDLATVIQGPLNICGPHQLNLQYCWVDFNRTWEVAHTDKRQQRCYDRYLDNAAVYYESICRVIDWNYFITGTFGGMFNQSIGKTLKKTPEGRNWLKTTPYAFVDVRSEVAYWQRAGIRRFVPQYTNGITWGLCETISIRNAFGAVQTISLKRMQYYHRGYFWTTMWMYWGPWGDISYASQGYSLIRNQSSVSCYFHGIPSSACSSIDFEKLLNAPNTPTVHQIHDHIGPLNSIDLLFVGIPPSLSQLFSAFQSRVNELILSSDTFAYLLAITPSLAIDPVPLPWQDSSFMYFGGDPTCVSRQPTSFVQSSFSFLVSCTKENRLELLLTPLGTLFGLWLAQPPMNASSICKVSATRKSSCKAVFLSAMDAFAIFNETYPQKKPSLNFSVNAASQSILDLDVSIIHFAINVSDRSNHFLRQNILNNDFAWDVFGWMYIYDWAAGSREVVSFEGDTNIISLISDIYDPLVHVADTLEVTKTACQYLWIISVITTSALVGVALSVATASSFEPDSLDAICFISIELPELCGLGDHCLLFAA
ncbi:hypothetical protein Ae201684P_003625 [Aphanomyces euteiches]|uniref:Uncharacterized protein n=1 Tax=Aphanomyces euteiches TaxID=100861 RepID=A0A6G0WNK9_9STRA|nr:hypothetical protein Ae201684_013353 [Aphanomyces euteiches]KAH9064844.1 hypothetical protein Ae201684P_003625 [Aphanomyces euteiches]